MAEDEFLERASDWTIEVPVEVRNADLREVDVRLLPYNHQVSTRFGPEMFRAGAFQGTDPKSVYFYGSEHEMRFGMGQDGQPKATRVPVGRAKAITDDGIGPVVTFKVARTAAGDETLALLSDGIISNVSVEFSEVPGGMAVENVNGRRTRVYNRAKLNGATPTHKPAYGEQAEVLAVRSEDEGVPEVPETTEPQVEPAKPAPVDFSPVITALDNMRTEQNKVNESFVNRLFEMGEQARSSFVVPGVTDKPDAQISRAEWVSIVLRSLSGDHIPQEQMRAAEDVITSDNIGVVPPAYLSELIGIIDASRPFMDSTRRLATPSSGMQLVVPVITARPTVAEQTTEKATLNVATTEITTKSFDMVTKGGYGDISLQLLKRADRSFLDLYLQLLGEAYAIESESEAVEALLHENEPLNPGPLDPESLSLGSAYETSFDAIRRPPDTIWLSTEAIAAFIDAKATASNQPLYPGLTASATAGGGITGTISGLRAVHVPALDVHGSYAIVGPRNGFAWAEDGTFTLQVDVPAKAGRDVALVGMLWFAPWYPAAFSIYNVAS